MSGSGGVCGRSQRYTAAVFEYPGGYGGYKLYNGHFAKCTIKHCHRDINHNS